MIENSRFKSLSTFLPLVVLMGGAYILYAQMFSGIWLMDDYVVLVDNPDVRSFSAFWEDSYKGRPLRELTYLLDYSFFGLEPAGYYIQHIFWHGLCAWLVFLLAKRLFSSSLVSCGTALLFLVHPIHVEVVANISHRKDPLALAFCLLAALFYLSGREGDRKSKRIGCFVLSALSWGIALMAKQNAAALPVVLVAYELFRVHPNYQRKVIAGAFGLAVFGVIARLIYMISSQEFLKEIAPALFKIDSFLGGAPETYFQTVFKAWAFMFSKFFYPRDLSMEYTFSVPAQWSDPWVLCGMFIAIAVVGSYFYFSRCSLLPYFSLVWFAAFWLPTSNLVDHLSYFAADRYWYTPSFALFLLMSYGIWKLTGPSPRRYLVVLLVPVVVLGWQAWQQQKTWLNEEVFYEHMLEVNPLALEGFVGAGQAAIKRADLKAAKKYFDRAFQRNPRDARVLQRLGYIAYKQGQHDLALDYLQRALTANPKMIATYSNLGVLYDDIGQPELAIELLEKGLKIDPLSAEIITNLGIVYEGLGRLEKAEEFYRQAVFVEPAYQQAHFNLGNTLYRMGRKEDALGEYLLAMQYNPEYVDAIYNYAVVASELGKYELLPAAKSKLEVLDPQLANELERELRGR